MSFETAFFECSAGLPDQMPASTLPEIAFSGRSNAGKSSLINRLLGRKSLARTSSAPGKTATVNFYNLDFCRFADLPGYGYARASKSEQARMADLAEGYFRSRREIRLVVQLVDARRAPTPDDRRMMEFLAANGVPFLIAAAKCDKLNRTARTQREELYRSELFPRGARVAFCSAVSGEGVAAIREKILSACAGPGKSGNPV